MMNNQPNQLTNMCLQSGATSQTPRVAAVQDPCVATLATLHKYVSRWKNRPQDNNMDFWVNFASEFYITESRRALCLTSYKNNSATFMNINRFHQDPGYKCVYCKQMPTRGYEISFQEMPGYFHNKFRTVQKETLRLPKCDPYKLQGGNTLLWFPEAEEESIQNDGMTFRKGSLAILFAPNNKIISWTFCMRDSQYYINKSALIPQICDLTKTTRERCSGQVCSQDKTEDEKLKRMVCKLAERCDMKQINELGLTEEEFKTYSNENNSGTDHPQIHLTQSVSRSGQSMAGPSCSERDRPNFLPRKSSGGLPRMKLYCSTTPADWHQTCGINSSPNMQLRAPPRFPPAGIVEQPECSNTRKRPFPVNPSGIDLSQLGCISKQKQPIQFNGRLDHLLAGPSTSLGEGGMIGTDLRQLGRINQQRQMSSDGTDPQELGRISQKRPMSAHGTEPLQWGRMSQQRPMLSDGLPMKESYCTEDVEVGKSQVVNEHQSSESGGAGMSPMNWHQPSGNNVNSNTQQHALPCFQPAGYVEQPECSNTRKRPFPANPAGMDLPQWGCISKQTQPIQSNSRTGQLLAGPSTSLGEVGMVATDLRQLANTNQQKQMSLNGTDPQESGHMNKQRQMSMDDTDPRQSVQLLAGQSTSLGEGGMVGTDLQQLGHINRQREMSLNGTDPQQSSHMGQQGLMSSDGTELQQLGRMSQQKLMSLDGTDLQQSGSMSQQGPMSSDGTDPQQSGRISQQGPMSSDGTELRQSGRMIQQRLMSSDGLPMKESYCTEDVRMGNSQVVNEHQSSKINKRVTENIGEFLEDLLEGVDFDDLYRNISEIEKQLGDDS